MSVAKNRHGTWFYNLSPRLSPTGKRVRVVIPTARTKAQALEVERKAIQDIHEGTYGVPTGSMLFRDYVKEYLLWAETNKASWHNDVYRVKPLLAFFGKKELREISPFLIEAYKRERLKTPIVSKTKKKDRTPATVNRDLALLSSIFRQARRDKKATENPCRDVENLKGEKHRQRYLLPEEEERLMAVLVGDRAHLKPMVTVAINTGLREMELLTLIPEQIDFNHRAILVHGKGDKDRWVPLNNTAERILRELVAMARQRVWRYLFTNPRTGSHFTTVKTAWNCACALAGIADLRFHDLRHTFGTRAADGGAGLGDLQKVMGHSQITTTMQYVHATEAGKRRAVAAVQGPPAKVLKIRKA